MVDAVARLARTVLAENLKIRKGESVLIESWTHSLPYVRAFVGEARRLGARPLVLYEDEQAWWDAVKHKELRDFAKLSKPEKAALSAADAYVYFWGPEDRVRADGLPDPIQNKIFGSNEEWYDVARKQGIRGCRMSVGQATDPVAKGFGLAGPTWRSRLVKAGAVPSKSMLRRGTKVAERLRQGKELTLRHPNGTDLTVQLGEVHARVDTGLLDQAAMKRRYGMMASNPSGQVLAALDGATARGSLVSNRTVYLGNNTFGGIRWTFGDGKLTGYSIKDGASIFEPGYAKAPKGRDQLSLLSIGLNPLSRNLPPCEDTEEGAVMVGIGNNAGFGGQLRIPFQSYALLGQATVAVDGHVLARGGRLV